MKIRIIFIYILLIITVGCNGRQGAPIESQPNTLELTSSLILERNQQYESIEDGIVITLPDDWAVHGNEILWIEPSASAYPKDSYFAHARTFDLYTMEPYVSLFNERWRIPQSATEVAQAISNTMDTAVRTLEPVNAVNINGRDGAAFLVDRDELHQYVIVLRIAKDKVVVLGALGPAERSEEMKTILNAIALSIQPLEAD